MKYPIVMPRLGATGDDVRIVEWLVAEGAPVKAGQALFVVETDKATSEVEAFRDGYLAQVIKGAGAECAPGEAVGELTDERAGQSACA
jgi:pyruvate dehydrogenase E2 component (dihydrolipoamide acetyltransferase)